MRLCFIFDHLATEGLRILSSRSDKPSVMGRLKRDEAAVDGATASSQEYTPDTTTTKVTSYPTPTTPKPQAIANENVQGRPVLQLRKILVTQEQREELCCMLDALCFGRNLALTEYS
jgi:hypothetical protein